MRLNSVEHAEGGPSEAEKARNEVDRLLQAIGRVEPNVVIEALERLVGAARAEGHEEASFWRKSLLAVKRHEGATGFNQLVTSLFGSQEDKRIASAVKCIKGEGEGRATGARAQEYVPPVQPPMQFAPQMAPPAYPAMYGYPQPAPQQPYYGAGGFSPRSPRPTGGPRRGPRGNKPEGGKCFGCGELGHRVADCGALRDFSRSRKQ